jgi:hypothetical protein
LTSLFFKALTLRKWIVQFGIRITWVWMSA